MSIGGYYKMLLDRVRSYIRSVGEISFDDLRVWAKGENIGLATLTAILNDLLKIGEISAPEGFMEVEDVLCSFQVPKIISSKPSVTVIPSKVDVSRESIAMEVSVEKSTTRIDLDWMKDVDLRRAVEYLNKYHSVGVIRFLRDLSDMGVSNPEAVLKRLISLGYVDYSPLGVVNASSKLPKISDKRLLSEFI
ncbi:MAG: hypothetical protein NDF57_04355 [archaeon GBS-70-058]|nr:hypothetical protein [Candidatus Culexarchaeum nevadense]